VPARRQRADDSRNLEAGLQLVTEVGHAVERDARLRALRRAFRSRDRRRRRRDLARGQANEIEPGGHTVRTIVIALFVLGSHAALAADDEPAPIGQSTVAGVLESLRADPSAQFREQRGWTVVASSERGAPVEWFFTPE